MVSSVSAVSVAAAISPLPRPRVVLFDWDNTLVDTWTIIHSALETTFTAMGHTPWTLDEVRARVKQSMRDSFPGLFGERWEEAAKIYQEAYQTCFRDGLLNALADAELLLQTLAEAGVVMGVVSNKMGPQLRKEIAHLEWGKYFAVQVGASDAARDKPHPDPVLLAMESLNAVPSAQVWFVGDTDVDMETANATGCTPVYYGGAPLAEDEKFRFAAEARTHREMLALFRAAH